MKWFLTPSSLPLLFSSFFSCCTLLFFSELYAFPLFLFFHFVFLLSKNSHVCSMRAKCTKLTALLSFCCIIRCTEIFSLSLLSIFQLLFNCIPWSSDSVLFTWVSLLFSLSLRLHLFSMLNPLLLLDSFVFASFGCLPLRLSFSCFSSNGFSKRCSVVSFLCLTERFSLSRRFPLDSLSRTCSIVRGKGTPGSLRLRWRKRDRSMGLTAFPVKIPPSLSSLLFLLLHSLLLDPRTEVNGARIDSNRVLLVSLDTDSVFSVSLSHSKLPFGLYFIVNNKKLVHRFFFLNHALDVKSSSWSSISWDGSSMNHQWDIKRYSLRHIVFSWPLRHSFSCTSFCWPPSSAIKHSFHPLCLEVSICSISYSHPLLRHLLSSSHWACYTHSCLLSILLLYYLSAPLHPVSFFRW